MYSEVIKNKYPDIVLEERNFHEAKVLSCLLRDLSILEDYALKKKDFISEEGAILFKIAVKMRKEGYLEGGLLDIKSKMNRAEMDFFEENDLWGFLDILEQSLDIANTAQYVEDLYRNNIFIELTDKGFDLLSEVDMGGKKIIPIELFKNMTTEQIKDYFDSMINDFGVTNTEKTVEECVLEITDEYIESVLAGLTIGTLFDNAGVDSMNNDIMTFPTISRESNGLQDGTLSILAGYSNVGKSTWLITLIMSLVQSGETIFVCSNEQTSRPFLNNILMWLLYNKLNYRGITKSKLKAGAEALSETDEKYLRKAQHLWNTEYKGKVHFVAVPSAKMSVVEKKMKDYYLKYGCTTFIYDTLKIDFSSARSEAFWLSLIEDSRILQQFANRYQTKVFATMQCAINTQGQLFLDANVLSTSKQVKEVLENLYILRDMYQEEKDPESPFYCRPFVEGKSSKNQFGERVVNMEAYPLDPEKSYKILFLDKLREGTTSQSSGVAIVIGFEGEYGVMREVCLCKPQRKNINASQRNSRS